MSKQVLRLVLLVSCAHALVHVYELALPGLEQSIAAEYFPSDHEAGRAFSGRLSNAWRLMWGLGAVAAGWLVDRRGANPMLALYLIGCALACAAAAASRSSGSLLASMIAMGALASIYHPAGLALISHSVAPARLPRALSLHGIFGSAGIGSGPLLAALLLSAGLSWRQAYLVLLLPGIALGLVFARRITADRPGRATPSTQSKPPEHPARSEADWPSFFTLAVLAACQGFIYSAVLSFLPRYLSDGGSAVRGNALAAVVLLLGCVGQAAAGRFARHERLEAQLTGVCLGNVPFLLAMAWADGPGRLAAAAGLALVHFMHQPLYNSLIAKYSPRARRSLCYGFGFAMGLGLGSFGAGFAGYQARTDILYGSLAAVAAAAAGLGVLLHVRQATRRNPASGACSGGNEDL